MPISRGMPSPNNNISSNNDIPSCPQELDTLDELVMDTNPNIFHQTSFSSSISKSSSSLSNISQSSSLSNTSKSSSLINNQSSVLKSVSINTFKEPLTKLRVLPNLTPEKPVVLPPKFKVVSHRPGLSHELRVKEDEILLQMAQESASRPPMPPMVQVSQLYLDTLQPPLYPDSLPPIITFIPPISNELERPKVEQYKVEELLATKYDTKAPWVNLPTDAGYTGAPVTIAGTSYTIQGSLRVNHLGQIIDLHNGSMTNVDGVYSLPWVRYQYHKYFFTMAPRLNQCVSRNNNYEYPTSLYVANEGKTFKVKASVYAKLTDSQRNNLEVVSRPENSLIAPLSYSATSTMWLDYEKIWKVANFASRIRSLNTTEDISKEFLYYTDLTVQILMKKYNNLYVQGDLQLLSRADACPDPRHTGLNLPIKPVEAVVNTQSEERPAKKQKTVPISEIVISSDEATSTDEEPLDTSSSSVKTAKSVFSTISHPNKATNSYVVFVQIDDHSLRALIDTGSDTSYLDSVKVEELKLKLKPAEGKVVLAMKDISVETLGSSQATITYGTLTCKHTFTVAELSAIDIIIGADLMPKLGLRIAGLQVQGTYTPSVIPKGGHELVISPDSEEERSKIIKSLDNLFNANEQLKGECSLPYAEVPIKILPGNEEKLHAYYGLSRSDMVEVRETTKRWLQEGKITEAPMHCPYNNPIVIVNKFDNKGNPAGKRMCLDFRRLNKAMDPSTIDRLPGVNILNTLQSICQKKLFTEIDISEAYLQIRLAEDAQPYTAFTVDGKQYMFKFAPFGLKHMSSIFQRIMNKLFKDIDYVFVYIDNILIFSDTWEEHARQVKKVMEMLHGVGFKIKRSKLTVGASQVRTLGHRIGNGTIVIDEKKLEAIRGYEKPRNADQLASFLGLVNYLSPHIRFLADLVHPLQELRTSKTFRWTEQHDAAFELIKDKILDAPMLISPNLDGPFAIICDASKTGIGGVLIQPSHPDEEPNANNIVGIYSRKLTKSERNYYPYKLEMLALVSCLRHFHQYVKGVKDLTVYTDHKPLIYMDGKLEVNNTIGIWYDLIQSYSFTITYKPGLENGFADALSRSHANDEESEVFYKGNVEDEPGFIKKGSKSKPKPILSLAAAVSTAATTTKKKNKDILKELHLLGHLGRDALLQEAELNGVDTTGMREVAREVISECFKCQQYSEAKKGFVPAKSITAREPWQHIQFDLKGPMPGMYKYLLVIVDVFSGYVVLEPLVRKDAPSIVTALFRTFMKFGVPLILQSDNETSFRSELMLQMETKLGVKRRFITPFNPRSDGKVERTIKTIADTMYKTLSAHKEVWERYIDVIMFYHNNRVQRITKTSPFVMMYGRQSSYSGYKDDETAEPLANCLVDQHPNDTEIKQWLKHQEAIVKLVQPSWRSLIQGAKAKQRKATDDSHRVIPTDYFKVGDPVCLYQPIRETGWEPAFDGPYKISHIDKRSNTYDLVDGNGDIFHRGVKADMLKKLVGDTEELVDSFSNVEEILGQRVTPNNVTQYLVKWDNDPNNEWVDEQDINAKDLIEAFHRSRRDQRTKGRAKNKSKASSKSK